jgi:hypothetical protein
MSNMVIPNPLFTNHFGESGRGLSPRLWSKIASHGSAPDGSQGFFVSNDFLNYQGFTNAISGTTALPSTTVPSPDGFQIYVDSATTASGVARLGTEPGGVARFAPGATDNHLAILSAGIFGELSVTAGEEKLTIFEARVRLHTQVTSGSTFIGLGTTSLVADGGLIADAGGLLATGAGIGFRTKEDDPDGIDIVYQAASQTEVVVSDAAKVIAADTWVKLGLCYDPAAQASEKVSFFIDNVKQASFVTATSMGLATFPNSVLLAPVFAAMTQATTTRGLDLDWFGCYQSA